MKATSVQPKFFAELSQVVRRRPAFQVVLTLVLHECLEGNTPVPADLAEGDLSRFQQSDEVRPRDIQHARGLLSSELGFLRYDLHASALPEKVVDRHEQ